MGTRLDWQWPVRRPIQKCTRACLAATTPIQVLAWTCVDVCSTSSATGGRGLVTDVDGTISPIVARPEEALRAAAGARGAHRPQGLPRRWWRSSPAARSPTCAQLVAIDGLTYIGNHGLETYSHGRAETLPEARPWVPRLAATLDQVAVHLPPELVDRVVIENKGATASLHYRLAHDPDARAARAARQSGALRGHQPAAHRGGPTGASTCCRRSAVTKGSAVTWLVRAHNLRPAWSIWATT